MLSFSKTDFIFGILCKTQLEQQAEVTDFLTKFHILMSFLWSLVYYTQYEINTVVHLRQIFIENLGAQETAKKKQTNMSLLLPGTLFSFPPIST